MITKRSFLCLVGAALLGARVVARAQATAGKVWKIGFLGTETQTGYARELEAFRGGLRDLGYIEGKNIVVEYRWAGGVSDRLAQLAVELVREKVDILVTHSGAGAIAAQRASTTVPIVLAALGGDPVALGLAKSLARPGGNVTGTLTLSTMLETKRLELIKDALPGARKVAFMVSTAGAAGQLVKRMEAAAKTLKLELHHVQVNHVNEFETAIGEMAERGIDAIIVLTGPRYIAHAGRVASLAAHRRIPTVGNAVFADNGGLIGYGVNLASNFRRAAYFIDRILKGTKPGDLPIEQPTTIELVVNLRTARSLGIRIPDTVMARADRVIE